MKQIDIIIPVYNEFENISRIYDRIIKLNLVEYEFQIIFINDGSTDETETIIKEINAKDKRVTGISFSRNFGHQAALSAGIDYSKADCIIMMDGDLQHPPEEIPVMIEKLLNK